MARLISGELATTAVSLLTLVVFVAAMLPHDPLLTAVGVAVGSLNLIVLRWFSRWRVDQNRAIEQIRGRLAAGVDVGDPDHRDRQGDGFRVGPDGPLDRRSGAGGQRRAATRCLRHDAGCISSPAGDADHDRGPGSGGSQVAAGRLTIGALVAFQSLLAGFNQPFRDLARLGAEVQELRADLDRIDDVRHHRIDPVLEPGRAHRGQAVRALARRDAGVPRLYGPPRASRPSRSAITGRSRSRSSRSSR